MLVIVVGNGATTDSDLLPWCFVVLAVRDAAPLLAAHPNGFSNPRTPPPRSQDALAEPRTPVKKVLPDVHATASSQSDPLACPAHPATGRNRRLSKRKAPPFPPIGLSVSLTARSAKELPESLL